MCNELELMFPGLIPDITMKSQIFSLRYFKLPWHSLVHAMAIISTTISPSRILAWFFQCIQTNVYTKFDSTRSHPCYHIPEAFYIWLVRTNNIVRTVEFMSMSFQIFVEEVIGQSIALWEALKPFRYQKVVWELEGFPSDRHCILAL